MRRFEQFEPQELRIIVDSLQEKRRHVFERLGHAGRHRTQQFDLLLDEAKAVLAGHDEEARLETDELMRTRGR